MINLVDLTGKHIVVTGASSGLGRAICVLISQLGADVSLIARREEKLVETIEKMEGKNHKSFSFDVSNVEDIEDLVKKIVAERGKIDGFVHVAGIGTVTPVSMTRYDVMLNMMKIHLFSFVEFVRVISKKKYSNDEASIVAVSSAGTIHSDKGKLAYSTTKGALDKAVRPLAIELGEARRFRVNTINPGWIKTEMYYDFIKEFGEEGMAKTLSTHVLGAAEPIEVANVAAFLLSNASKKITGQNIVIDGGWTIHG